ncbi:hypothetical protein PENTCL1PPCAC_24869, partial [Pristionchus entomophagus]
NEETAARISNSITNASSEVFRLMGLAGFLPEVLDKIFPSTKIMLNRRKKIICVSRRDGSPRILIPRIIHCIHSQHCIVHSDILLVVSQSTLDNTHRLQASLRRATEELNRVGIVISEKLAEKHSKRVRLHPTHLWLGVSDSLEIFNIRPSATRDL